MTSFQTFHAGEAYVNLRRDLDWELLTPHARAVLQKCLNNREGKPPATIHPNEALEASSSTSAYFYSWLQRLCCDATPATAVVENGLICDRAFAGGRLLSYRHRTHLIIGGSAAPSPHAAPHRPSRRPLSNAMEAEDYDTDDDADVDNCCSEQRQGSFARSRYGSGAATAITATAAPATAQGCAAVEYGRCILVHGGISPAGEATDELRAFVLQPDPNRPGEYDMYGRMGACELLDDQCPLGSSAAPPPYHDDAVAMADDTLPYIYVYGARERSCGAAALGGGSFVPSLHRVCIDGGGGGAAAAAGRWETVELLGTARLHVARRALGTASGGTVTLVGGVRDARRGVEPQVQVVAVAAPSKVQDQRRRISPTLCYHEYAAAARARCRRVLVERLRKVAPREIGFARPRTAAAAGRYDGVGGGDGDGGGEATAARTTVVAAAAAARPCKALAAALSLYSRSGLFDDFFEELDGDEDEAHNGGIGGGGGGGTTTGHGGGGVCTGMTIPGHDPLAVAAVVAWVMGRTHVRADWEPRFLLQVFRMAHCWELVALQREVAALTARLAPLLPLEQLPAALGLAASSCRVDAGNMEEVMEAVVTALAAEDKKETASVGPGRAPGGDGDVAASLLSLQQASVSGVDVPADVLRWFGITELLFRAMRWWRRRLATTPRDDFTLDQLLRLMDDLQDTAKLICRLLALMMSTHTIPIISSGHIVTCTNVCIYLSIYLCIYLCIYLSI
ncbi:hypothetical protein VOLCADRAFT_91398 [Volvox carteri f. nagariensis]|uniref:Uncharacterized protein n=1 Tax=Volvox carteri f. nagariensis TaxID=3068 RepID=D8TWZ0_VOLCA|nr:uncharacterized protein VOLCADRAFT_91398 [Volvox carteri f. nagariensis]EFJ47817.1 hypothetical protein VOLCADRAFT_91398 [Volvox carteri f. nagariensis]|eukprot:XP_002950923.1 hypothetical protein VOLCADRAFT_91398 [Volvox carteri f. nagariensis]